MKRAEKMRNKLLYLLLLLPLELIGQPTPIVNTLTYQSLAVAPPTNCTIAVIGVAGSTTLFYWPVANYPGGQSIVPVPLVVNNAPTVLNGSNFVQVNCGLPSPATTLDLLRSTTNTISEQGTASVAVATGSTTGIFQDQGGALSSYTFNVLRTQFAVTRLNSRDFAAPKLEWAITSNPGSGTFGPLPLGSGGVGNLFDLSGNLVTPGSGSFGGNVNAGTSSTNSGCVDFTAKTTLAVFSICAQDSAATGGVISLSGMSGNTLKFSRGVYAAGLQNSTIGAGASKFFGIGSTPGSATEAPNNQFVFPLAGTLFNLYVVTAGTQAGASGNMVCALKVNGVASALIVTIPFGSAQTVWSDLTDGVPVNAGDLGDLGCVSTLNATSIGFIGWGVLQQ